MSTKTTARSADTGLKSFGDHLGELRWRIAAVALVFIVLSSLAYNIRDLLVHIVLSPIGNQKLVYLTPAGGFSFIFSVTIYAGILATAPLMVYHLYKFIAPALPARVRKHSVAVIAASTALMVAGVCFGYFVAIPAALTFLTKFAGGFVQPNLTADSYLSFVVAYVLGLGLMFQLPLLLIFWNWVKPFEKGQLLDSQRFVLVGAFIAAALITPTPDMLNQTMIALPIIMIYQLGVMAVFFSNRNHRRLAAARARSKVTGVKTVPQAKLPGIVPPSQSARPLVQPTHIKPSMGDVTRLQPVKSFSVPLASGQVPRRGVPRTARPQRAPQPARQPRARAGVDFVASSRAVRAARPLPTLDGVYRVSGLQST